MPPRPHRSFALSIVTLAVIASLIGACGSEAGSSINAPTVNDAWARVAASGGQSAAYFTIANTTSAPDALLSATSPAAAVVEIHETRTDDAGMTGMHPLHQVAIPAGESVEFKPGSNHLMLAELTGELVVGQMIELSLVFEHGGAVTVMAEIRQA